MMMNVLAVVLLAMAGPGEHGGSSVASDVSAATLTQQSATAKTLSLEEAIARAVAANPARRAALAQVEITNARQQQAKARELPRLDLTYRASRSDNPVQVFGQKLSQGRFAESDFAIDSLNAPAAINNFQTWLGVTHTVWDGGRRGIDRADAKLEQAAAVESERQVAQRLVFDTIRTYLAAQVTAAHIAVIDGAMATTAANVARATARVDAGLATQADALALAVQSATLREQRLQADTQLQLLKADLNRLLAEPLDATWTLSTGLADTPAAESVDRAALVEQSHNARPTLRIAQLEVDRARNGVRRAATRWLPQVDVQAAQMWDHHTPFGDGGASYMIAAAVSLNLFDGLADRARSGEATAALALQQARRDDAVSGVDLEIRQCALELATAHERITVVDTAIRAAAEALRITSIRFEAGLADVTELLRGENDLLAAQARRLEALFEQRVALARLNLAVGTDAASSNGRS